MLKNSIQKKMFPLLALAIGAIYGFNLLGLTPFNPFDTGWQFNQHDSSTHFIGWAFFRHEPWTFPLGRIQSYVYPKGTSIVFTDSIPLAAFALKLFNPLLAADFQYFGIWRLISYALQGLLGYLLIFRVTKNEFAGLAGSLLFIIAPIFNSRIDHAALQSHWLILCALYLYLRKYSLNTHLLWLGLLIVSALIHFYLLAMVITIWGAFLIREWTTTPIPKRSQLIISLLGTLTLLTLLMWVAGYFVSGMDVSPPPRSSGSFGQRSMNLNALFNPGYGISGLYIPKLPIISNEQWNGFSYLGVGMLLLLIISLYSLWGNFRLLFKKHFALSTTCLLLTCFAISNVVTFGEQILFEIPIPDWGLRKLNLFRASGRFIWPVNYILLTGGCAALAKKYSRQTTFFLLCLIASIQIMDLWSQHWRRSQLFENRPEYCAYPLTSPLWQEFSKKYRHIAFIPPNFNWLDNQCDDYVHFAKLAITNGMTLNVGYLARHDNRSAYSDALTKQFSTGMLPPDTLYILKDWTKNKPYATEKYTFAQGALDGFTILAPNANAKLLYDNPPPTRL